MRLIFQPLLIIAFNFYSLFAAWYVEQILICYIKNLLCHIHSDNLQLQKITRSCELNLAEIFDNPLARMSPIYKKCCYLTQSQNMSLTMYDWRLQQFVLCIVGFNQCSCRHCSMNVAALLQKHDVTLKSILIVPRNR